jgi:putative ABC transport system permease protein
MFRNYLVVAIRNLKNSFGYSIINIVGLAIGMACCILILLLIQDEVGYDTHHEHSDRIHRVVRDVRIPGAERFTSTGTSGPLADALVKEFPEVERAVTTMNFSGIFVFDEERGHGFSQRFCTTEPDVFEIFSLPLIKGDPATAISKPGTVVVRESVARKFFGDEDPMGKVLSVEYRYYKGEYVVTGVMEDQPLSSSINFDFITSSIAEFPAGFWDMWRAQNNFYPQKTWILMKEGADAKALERKLPDLMERKIGKEIRDTNTWHLQPIERIHLYSTSDYDIPSESDISYIYTYLTVAIFILTLASINFMNLATARSAGRAREVGVRKASGAYQRQLIGQFLGESILLALISMVLAVGLVEAALPTFNNFIEKDLALLTELDFTRVSGLLGVALLVGTLAGAYPALFLSAFRPVEVLKGSKGQTSRPVVRKALVVFQFAISIFLMIGSITVRDQINFIRNKNLGYQTEHTLALWLFNTDRTLTDRYQEVKRAFLDHPNVLKAAASHSVAAGVGQRIAVDVEGFEPGTWQIPVLGTDEDFLETYKIELLSGRNFSVDIPTDSTDAFILNETAVKTFGYENPIGKRFAWPQWERDGVVVGVVKDFHFGSLRDPIGPLVMCVWQDKFNALTLRVRGNDLPETMAFLEKTWRRFIPKEPFDYVFLEEYLNSYYGSDLRLGKTLDIFSGLAVLVACLGLFGLASFTAEQRRKEIGVRKALAASEASIIRLLSGEFMKLVAIALVIATPLAYYGMHVWLQEFHYKIELGAGTFLLCGVVALAIAQLTVSYQAIRASRLDPVEALRYE